MNGDVLHEKKKERASLLPVKTRKPLTFLELKGDLGNNLVPSPGFTSKETGVLKSAMIDP